MPERCPGDYPHLSAFSANALDDLGIPRCPVSTATRSAPIEPEQNPLPGAPLPNLAALNLEEPVALDFGARAQDFLKRITPLFCRSRRPRPHSAPWPSRNSTEFAKPKSAGLKARYTLATVKLALSKYRNAIRAVDPDHLVLRPRKMRHRPAEIFFSASFSLPREKLPYPALLFDGQLKTRQAPGTSSEPYLTFPPPSAPSTYPGNAATCALPTAPSVVTASKGLVFLGVSHTNARLRCFRNRGGA
jgi:hypothetical protein